MNANEKPAVDHTESSPNVQGEGDYESTRRYNKDTERFLKNADVPEAGARGCTQVCARSGRPRAGRGDWALTPCRCQKGRPAVMRAAEPEEPARRLRLF